MQARGQKLRLRERAALVPNPAFRGQCAPPPPPPPGLCCCCCCRPLRRAAFWPGVRGNLRARPAALGSMSRAPAQRPGSEGPFKELGMEAVLELVLREEVAAGAVVRWLKASRSSCAEQESQVHPKLSVLGLLQKDFVPFLLNYLREQTSQILTNGPSTPAKTPKSKALGNSSGYRNQRTGPERRTNSTTGSSSSRVKLFCDATNDSLSPLSTTVSASESHGSVYTGSSLSGSCSDSPNLDPSSPNFGSGAVFHRSERRSGQKASLGNFFVAGAPRRGRRKGNNSLSASVQPVVQELGWNVNDERKNDSSSMGSSGQRKQSEESPVATSSPLDQLNLNDMEQFPPMNAAGTTKKTKPSRRINPTPVSTERPLSKPKMCFTSTPVGQSPISVFQSEASPEAFPISQGSSITSILGSLQEEREMLKKERSKFLHHTSSSSGLSLDFGIPNKTNCGWNTGLLVENQLVTSADVKKVTCRKQLELLAQLYSSCIAENLVPNIFLELFFVLQLLTSKRSCSPDDQETDTDFDEEYRDAVERQHFRSVHNCVCFAVHVLDYQFEVVSHLDKGTLKLLAENERVASFSPDLHKRLTAAYENSTAKVTLLLPSSVQSVSFQPETDDRSNFSSDKAFHIFKKQRDIFYELLREWEDNSEKSGWDFERCLGNRIRVMMAHLSAACNYSHFARLFQKQLLQMCRVPTGGGISWGDPPDQDVLNMLGSDNLSRLKRLQERFIVPQSIRGPCPPPSFPGCQEFFRDFILSAGSYQFNQHLMDSLCLQILELNALTLVEHERSDGDTMDEQNEKKRFAAVLMNLRLLAKFFGFLVFLPYHTVEPPTGDLQASAVTLRNHTLPVLDILKLLRQSVQKQRTVLTVPWVVEFLSLMDHIAPFLDYYAKIFTLLLQLYKCLLVSEDKKMCFLNKLLILAVLGWLFQVPTVPVNLFFEGEARLEGLITDLQITAQTLDSVPLVDQQLLYSCCPYLGELKKLLSSFVSGSGGKNGGYIRKITPTAAESLAPKPSVTQQKLQAELEQAFFHNHPPSLRRTVEFVAERIGSNCVKHIKATLVAELVRRAGVILQGKVKEEDANYDKLLDGVCSELYAEGAQAITQAQEFCRKKGPEAVKILLPEEITAAVLSCAANIAVGLATEKACSWLSTNISALIKREVKATFGRMLKVQGPSLSGANEGVQRKKSCPPDCRHQIMFPSQIINEIKDVLCITVGPRDEDEEVEFLHLEGLLERLRQTLQCRKFICPASEQQLAKCTVELASLLVSDRVPILGPAFHMPKKQEQQQAKNHLVCSLLKSLLSMWKEDFEAPVPLQLFFSRRNTAYLADNKPREWDLFLFMLHGIVDYGLMSDVEIQRCLHDLQKSPWPADFSKEFDALLRIFISEKYTEEPKSVPCELLGQPRGAVAAQS
ncbi:codanin-1 [Paroedura picta]|uniref:codanin-1 n=1 Tax=Paroedura picta TaxID=143630 RepID=UPI004057844C